MAKKVKLKVSDRINIINNAQKLGCTWPVRCKFDEFIDTVNVSDEDYEKAGVGRDENGKIAVKNDFEVEYDTANVPDVIKKAIEDTIINLEEASIRTPNMKPMYEDVKNSLGLIVDVEAL
jgi:hypothetical protein